jgi:hypothetical protein
VEWLTNLLAWVASPWTSLSRRRRRLVLLIVLNVVILVVGLVGLYLLADYLGLERLLRTRWLGLHRVWLPLCFLVGYLLFWLFWGLWRLLGPDRQPGEFDDIERAWSGAMRELSRAGIALTDVPVYLVLGRPAGGLESFFAATRQPFQVRHAPGPGGPLHVYANREAVFVTCEEASLLAVQAGRFEASEPEPAATAAPEPIELLEAVGGGDQFGALLPAEVAAGAALAGSVEPAAPAAPAPAVEPPKPTPAGVLLLGEPEPEPGQAVAASRRRAPLIKDEETVDLQARRLRHVCRLLVRDRQPYCPVNGIVLLVPLGATGGVVDASETASVCRQDLEVARTALQLDCPVLAVLCDADRLPGFSELARHFPEGQEGPARVLGQHFPLIPDVAVAEVQALIENGLAWVADALLPLVVGRLWRREGEEGVTDRAAAVQANVHLYEFLQECRHRLRMLGRLAARAVIRDEGPPLLGGCYAAGTGADERDQAFLAGVVRKLLEHQNDVTWTPTALAEDAAYRRYARVGYVVLAAVVATVAAILWMWERARL